MRIVSLLPSATEIVCALGLEDSLVGISHECDYPLAIGNRPQLTASGIGKDLSGAEIDARVRAALQARNSLYTVDTRLLAELAPDVIVTQGLCAVCAVSGEDVAQAITALPRRPQVVNLEPSCLGDLFETIRLVGAAAAVPARATALVAALEQRVERVARAGRAAARRPRIALLEWLAPPFTAGHWTPELIALAGGVPCLGAAGARSRTASWSEVASADPDRIVVACCGLSLERTAAELAEVARLPGWRNLRAVRNGAVTLVDGNHYFNRPGPRLIDSLELLAHLLAPALHPRPACWDEAIEPLGRAAVSL